MNNGRKYLVLAASLGLLAAWIYPYLPYRGIGLCAVKKMIAFGCPGCGFIRSVAHLMHGHFSESVTMNPMGLVAVVLAVLYFLTDFVLRPLLNPKLFLSPKILNFTAIAFVAGLFLQWMSSIYLFYKHF